METIEVHSKDFLIRWVEVESASKITWKIHPQKRSINFGVFAHCDDRSSGSSFADATGSLAERLDASGFEALTEGGLNRIEAKETTEGSAVIDRRVLVAFVFDNTFSISNSKHVQFSFNIQHTQLQTNSANLKANDPDIELLDPSNAAGIQTAAAAAAAAALYPRSSDASYKTSMSSTPFPNMQQSASVSTENTFSSSTTSRKLSLSKSKSPDGRSRTKSLRKNTQPSLSGSIPSEDEESTAPKKLRHRPSTFSNNGGNSDTEVVKSIDGRFVYGFLQKKRRKQFQGFARRYFSLDKQTGLLNYYLNNRSSSLRGVMPIKIAELRTDEQNLIFTLNSGMEKWVLKANDVKTFNSWCSELKEVHIKGAQDESEPDHAFSGSKKRSNGQSDAAQGSAFDETGISAIADESQDDDFLPEPGPLATSVPSLGLLREQINALPASQARRDLQKCYKKIIEELRIVNKLSRPSRESHHGQSSDTTRPSMKSRLSQATIKPLMRRRNVARKKLKGLYDRTGRKVFVGFSVLGLLLGVAFGASYTIGFLLALFCIAGASFVRYKKHDIETSSADASADANDSFVEAYSSYGLDYVFHNRQVNMIGSLGSDDEDEADDFSDASDEEDRMSSVSSVTTHEMEKSVVAGDSAMAVSGVEANGVATSIIGEKSVAGTAETTLYPLPHELVKRRSNIHGPTQQPPSLLALLKKAKDPSNMTAPITSNEPLSGVEAVAEMFENANILDAASKAAPRSHQRVIMVAVFAVARLAGMRIKDRTLRKPFTPLLGESFELVREDLGFRFVAEKVTHKPEVVATQAESKLWTVHFTSRPHTKMWAKSIQLTDVGHVSITFPDGEVVSFINPELFVRNILAGERYVEPSGSVTVESNAGSNLSAVIEFKAGGMFSGRSEEVKITCGKLTYEGKWTEAISDGSKTIWTAKPLVNDPHKHYGWPIFTAQLNEMTEIENDSLPPNDSRLRPDLRLYEDQSNIEEAENLKLTLEQHQRERRKDLETAGKQHEPFFFVKSKDSKGHYKLRHGDRNYWNLRENRNWETIPHYFE